jgi:hypothetical protein
LYKQHFLERVIELRYHKSQDTMLLFKSYWYDINKGIKVDPHHDLVQINKNGRFCNINDVFVFAK